MSSDAYSGRKPKPGIGPVRGIWSGNSPTEQAFRRTIFGMIRRGTLFQLWMVELSRGRFAFTVTSNISAWLNFRQSEYPFISLVGPILESTDWGLLTRLRRIGMSQPDHILAKAAQMGDFSGFARTLKDRLLYVHPTQFEFQTSQEARRARIFSQPVQPTQNFPGAS